MHLVFNAGTCNHADGWCDIVTKGTGKRIRAAENELYDNKVDMFWQKKAWVDNEVMMKVARKFVNCKNEKHGEDVWVLLFCDNLGAHVRDDIRKSFGDNKVFFCYFRPGMTNFIQSIDAGLGRSVRISVG